MGTQAIANSGDSTSSVVFKPETNVKATTNVSFDDLAKAIEKNAELTDKRNRDIARSSYEIAQEKLNADREISQANQNIKNKEISTRAKIELQNKKVDVANLSLKNKDIEQKALMTKSIIFISIFGSAIFVFMKSKKDSTIKKKGKK